MVARREDGEATGILWRLPVELDSEPPVLRLQTAVQNWQYVEIFVPRSGYTTAVCAVTTILVVVADERTLPQTRKRSETFSFVAFKTLCQILSKMHLDFVLTAAECPRKL
eukprot:3893868-Rhodomonas_salina.1